MVTERIHRIYRSLPSVDELLRRPTLADAFQKLGPRRSTEVVRAVLQRLREEVGSQQSASEHDASLAQIEASIKEEAARLLRPSLLTVINATGVILHTNLGRAPLSAAAAQRVAELAQSYSNLEFDLTTGHRGKRDVHVESLACSLTGAERTIVVNNNAAAVLLLLNTFAGDGGEVIVSRGELVEIGGSFRVPDIMTRSGARLVEVGTTNRTRIADYRAALTPDTRLLLRVHRSNFEMRGFVEQPALNELVGLGRGAGVPVAEDLGSGCLFDLRAAALAPEPTVKDSLHAGVDVVTYSGDKLLGGPQAGLLSGKKAIIDRLRQNPMFRALRVDRLTYAALEVTLAAYAAEDYDAIPALRMIRAGDLEKQARSFADALLAQAHASAVKGESVIGGGSSPGQSIPTWLVALAPDEIAADELLARLRAADPPVIARIENDRVVLDLRTVLPDQRPALHSAIERALTPRAENRAINRSQTHL
jgi:L-seryl-tRNA(Ser) seleniumtransferase